MSLIVKKLFLSTVVVAALLSSTNAAAAGSCGTGYITAISEGAWGLSNFRIKLNPTIASSSVGRFSNNRTIQFKSTLPEEQYRGIKAIAYLAFSSGKPVRVHTSGNACSEADELNIFIDEGAVF